MSGSVCRRRALGLLLRERRALGLLLREVKRIRIRALLLSQLVRIRRGKSGLPLLVEKVVLKQEFFAFLNLYLLVPRTQVLLVLQLRCIFQVCLQRH